MIPMGLPCRGSRSLRGITRSALIVLLLSSSHAAADEPLVVHEWGVMIREGGDLLGPPVELFDAVPKFVLQHHRHFRPHAAPIIRIWKKPVLHFYGKPGTKVKARVMTPKGRPSLGRHWHASLHFRAWLAIEVQYRFLPYSDNRGRMRPEVSVML